MSRQSLEIINAATATFECVYGRGCDGLCCQNGRPSLTAPERAAIDGQLPRLLERLRPAARKLVERDGYLSNRTKLGEPMLRVVEGWCVFFHNGCTIHQLGIDDCGDFSAYKPFQCVIFPLEPNGDGRWYVRQHGYMGERWDLFCLNPKTSTKRAIESLAPEIEYVERRKLTADHGSESTANGEPA